MSTSFRLKWLCPIIVQFPVGSIQDRVYGYRRRTTRLGGIDGSMYSYNEDPDESRGLKSSIDVDRYTEHEASVENRIPDAVNTPVYMSGGDKEGNLGTDGSGVQPIDEKVCNPLHVVDSTHIHAVQGAETVPLKSAVYGNSESEVSNYSMHLNELTSLVRDGLVDV